MWLPEIRGRVILMSVFNIFQTIGYYGFNNWVPSLLVKQGITISTSLGYTTVIALAAPIGPLLGFFLGDRLERKWIIVAAAGAILICGLIFGQARDSALIIAMGVGLTLAANIMSFSFHAYQQELFPTGIRARAAGFVYSWSRLSVIFSSFIIAFVLERAGAFGVFVFIAAAMGVVMATIGFFGPRTTNLALEKISGEPSRIASARPLATSKQRERVQLLARRFGEVLQWIDAAAVLHDLANVGDRSIRREISVEDRAHDNIRAARPISAC